VRADDDFVNDEELVDYAAGNSANDEDPPISRAFKEGLFVDSIDDEEPVLDDEPVASLAPVSRASEERADDDSVNNEELIDYELPVAPQDNEGSVASVERGWSSTPLSTRSSSTMNRQVRAFFVDLSLTSLPLVNQCCIFVFCR
jgi:hypothetical protein